MAESKYGHYAVIQFLSEVEVLRPEKVKRRDNGSRWKQ
jgi:hypothetical protein